MLVAVSCGRIEIHCSAFFILPAVISIILRAYVAILLCFVYQVELEFRLKLPQVHLSPSILETASFSMIEAS